MAIACRDCKFYAPTDDSSGNCRHDPPIGFPSGPNQFSSFWPPVLPGFWCGKYEKALVLVPRGMNQ